MCNKWSRYVILFNLRFSLLKYSEKCKSSEKYAKQFSYVSEYKLPMNFPLLLPPSPYSSSSLLLSLSGSHWALSKHMLPPVNSSRDLDYSTLFPFLSTSRGFHWLCHSFSLFFHQLWLFPTVLAFTIKKHFFTPVYLLFKKPWFYVFFLS